VTNRLFSGSHLFRDFPAVALPFSSRITRKTMKRISILLFLAFSVQAAPMVRVVSVRDARTIVVDNRGVAAVVALAQVVVPPAEEAAAAAYLRDTLTGAWVMVETDAHGQSYVYRSPDAMFINGELSRRAYATRNEPQMIYLGEVMPGPRRAETPPRTVVVKKVPARRKPRR
jgi:hypothetical protein